MTTSKGGRPAPRMGVKDQHLDTAEQMLDALRSKTWGEPQSWIYRGQANADWKLEPSIVRSPSTYREFGIEGDTSYWSPRERAVIRALTRFRNGLDASGVPIPVQPPPIHGGERNRSYVGRIEPDAYPLMALAQHHGLPTLLLDWTRRGPVAAYIAASSALNPRTEKRGDHLAVWALHAKPGDTFGHGSSDRVRLVLSGRDHAAFASG